MRKLVPSFLFLLFIVSCTTDSNDFSIPKKVVITGNIKNIDSNKLDVKLSVNRIGRKQTAISTQADSLGNFHVSFETYTPTDVWILYKTNFLTLVKPGDSIHVQFDGKPNTRPKILETIKFSGDGTNTNQDAAKFQLMYFSDPLYYDWDSKINSKKNYDVDQYLAYADTLQLRISNLYNSFVNEVNPNKTVKIWARTFIEQDYYEAIAWYPTDYMRANNLSIGEWSAPDDFFDRLLLRLPIEKTMLISGYALSGFVNRFHYNYARKKIWQEEENKQYVVLEGHGYGGPTHIIDSISIHGIIKYTPDPLLRQMVLTEYFQQNLEKFDVEKFERFKNIIDEYILEPFLKEPLLEKYTEVKNQIEDPVAATNAYLNKLENSTFKQLWNSILSDNKGKIIYLDCWATWCAPCKAEMPHSKKLMEELQDKDIAFVFLCIDSQEKFWKANLSELQIEGQHFFLTQEQSNDLREAFEIQGIPYYFLIDQSGVIIEKGSHLRPNTIKNKLIELIEK